MTTSPSPAEVPDVGAATADLIRQVREAAEKATPGRWADPVYEDTDGGDEGWWILNGRQGIAEHAVAVVVPYDPNAEADAQWIVTATTAAPLLADRLEAAEAENARLAGWKAEAMEVMSGLQDVGRALGLPLGTSITGTTAAEAATALRAENARLSALLAAALSPEGIDRAARALAVEAGYETPHWPHLRSTTHDGFRASARAAVRAALTPPADLPEERQ